MSDIANPTDSREDLRRQWLGHANAVFDRLFPEGPARECPPFEDLEQRSVQLSRDLASWLLERRAASSDQVRPVQPPCCPRCQRPAQRVTGPDEPLPKRVLTTSIGDVGLAREKWRCTTCRVVFFPPGRAAEADPGGV
jgi:hypothetical protein